MTATANTSIAGKPETQLPTIATIKAGPGSLAEMPSGIFCNGALAAPDGQMLYLSLIGRDTDFQAFRGLMSTGKLNSFTVLWDGGGKLDGWFSREWLGDMQYHGSKLQTALFGEVTQMVLYHPLMTAPDKATRRAVVPYQGQLTDRQPRKDAWNLVKHICDVPLLDGWEHAIMGLLAANQCADALTGFACSAYHFMLKDMAAVISANIRSGALGVDGSIDMGKLTLNPDYGRAAPSAPPPPEPPQNGADDGDGDDDGCNGDWDSISTYSRAEAIEDGFLVDVSGTAEAREAGFIVPVALTSAVWERYAWWDNDKAPPKQRGLGQSTAGRLWDILYMARLAMKGSRQAGNSLLYRLYAIPCDGRSTNAREITLKIHSGPGDHGEHVITVMLPDED